MNTILRQQNLRRDLGIASWKEADHEDKIEKLIDLNDILFERAVGLIIYMILFNFFFSRHH